MLNDNWLYTQWQELKTIQNELDDKQFIERFDNIYKTFISRKPYLNKCADYISKIYKSHDDQYGVCRVLEPALGCNVFPDILSHRGFNAIGLEPGNSLTARFCKIQGLSIITPETWDSDWCNCKFDLIVLICYYTSPQDDSMGEQAVKALCNNVFKLINIGAELVLFDTRYADYIIEDIIAKSLSITWRAHKIRKGNTEFYIFYKEGTKSTFRLY